MATKKLDVPDIGNLLGKISEKRDNGEIPKAPIQAVQPVQQASENIATNTPKQENLQQKAPGKAPGGRPSAKKDSVDYVKISPRIPKPLKRQVDLSIVEERFRDRDGNPIKTLDELVAFALDRLVR